ncbi:MAG: SCO family protein [Thermoproteota archaeon]
MKAGIVALLMVAAAVLVGVTAGLAIGHILFSKIDLGTERVNEYVQVAAYSRVLEPVEVQTTVGRMVVPVPGKVNVVVPQYVLCPNVCHWETNIMLYAFNEVLKRGLEDEVVFVTLSVDPWFETLEDARRYQLEKAGDYLEKGIRWVWVHDSEEVMRRLWSMYGIYVEPHPEQQLVDHSAGFIIVDRSGAMRYYVSPTSEGWIRGQRVVAEELVKRIMEVVGGG